mgnify:CR=1 FL=1
MMLNMLLETTVTIGGENVTYRQGHGSFPKQIFPQTKADGTAGSFAFGRGCISPSEGGDRSGDRGILCG